MSSMESAVKNVCMGPDHGMTMMTFDMHGTRVFEVFFSSLLLFRKFDHRDFYGLYVSKTPINSQLAYFEVEVLLVTDKRHIGVGLCHPYYPINQMLGWKQASIAIHADNGQ